MPRQRPPSAWRYALRLLRFNEWWDKMLHLTGAATLLWLTMGKTVVGIGALGLYLAAAFCLLTVGYAVNSAADFTQDRVSGRFRRQPPPARAHSGLTAGAAAAMALLFISAATKRSEPLLISLLTLIVGCGYSLPPLRFKERGTWGVLVGAVTQKPALFLIFAAMLGNWNWLCALLAFWLFCGGLLGMLGHQILDRDADTRAGVKTFVTLHGSRSAACLCLISALGVAGACLAPLAIAARSENLFISSTLGLLSSVYLFKSLRARRRLFAASAGRRSPCPPPTAGR